MNQEIDINLIEGLIKQNPKAQQTMLDRYGQLVFAQVSRLVSGIENAEEVYQDVFIKVFRSIDTYDATKSSLRTWLSRIAYHESISYLRRSSLPLIYYEDREGEAEKLSESEVDATFGQPNPETVQLIRAALKHLPPDERAITTMFSLIPCRVSGFCLRFYLKRNNFLHKSFVCIVFFVYLQSLLI